MTSQGRNNLEVLLVEDNPDLGEVLQSALLDEGFRVLHVSTGEEALSRLSRLSGLDLPDVIVFDLRLPGMGGAELSGALREHPRWRGIPRVLITGQLIAPHEEASLDVSEIFQKPLDVMALSAGLRRLGEHRSFDAVVA